jgi:hypothetical protein
MATWKKNLAENVSKKHWQQQALVRGGMLKS